MKVLLGLLTSLLMAGAASATTTGQGLDPALMTEDYIVRGQTAADLVAESLDVNEDGLADPVSIVDGRLQVTVAGTPLPLRLNGSNLALPAGWRVAGFNSRSTPAIVLRNVNTTQVGVWEVAMGVNSVDIVQNYFLPDLVANWELVSGRSLQGTSKWLTWRNKQTGENAVWSFETGGQTVGSFLPTTALTWKLVGLGEFGGSTANQGDFLWRNINTEELGTWQMNGNQFTFCALPNVGLQWSIRGISAVGNPAGATINWQQIPAPNQAQGTTARWNNVFNCQIGNIVVDPNPGLGTPGQP